MKTPDEKFSSVPIYLIVKVGGTAPRTNPALVKIPKKACSGGSSQSFFNTHRSIAQLDPLLLPSTYLQYGVRCGNNSNRLCAWYVLSSSSQTLCHAPCAPLDGAGE